MACWLRPDTLLAVVTQPGPHERRHLQCRPCVVKAACPVLWRAGFNPEDASEESFVEELSALAPDVIVVASYGQFLKRNLLAAPRLGVINVHPSLLPKYRGASPIQWALANGETTTGVSVLYVTPKMDAGDILAQEAYPIDPDDTFCTLEPKLAALGMELLARVLDNFRNGQTEGRPQDESQVTFARKLTKADACVDWQLPARPSATACAGLPLAGRTHLAGWSVAQVARGGSDARAGRGSARHGDRCRACGAGGGDGGGRVAFAVGSARRQEDDGRRDFLRGYPLTTGARLGLQ